MVSALALRRQLWETGVFNADDGGAWRVKEGNLLICERGPGFFVAIAMGTEAVRLEPDNAAWVRRI